MNGYICFYGSKRIEVYADTAYAAQKMVADQLKVPPKKQYLISVNLAEKAGEQVTHAADF